MTELNENANELLGDFLELLVEYFRKVILTLHIQRIQRRHIFNKKNLISSLAINRAVPTTLFYF